VISRFKYSAVGYLVLLFALGIAVLLGGFGLKGLLQDHQWEYVLLLLFASMFAFITYFSYPVELELGADTVEIKYLFGPSLCAQRRDVDWKRLGSILQGRVRGRGLVPFAIGRFLVNSDWLSNSDVLFSDLGLEGGSGPDASRR
jgi:hypothetical protein